MNINLPKNRNQLLLQLRDPLFKNSLYNMLTSIFSSGLGFLFWLIAAKLYIEKDVGLATALISSISLLILFSRFGFDSSIIRFLPTNDRSTVFSTSAIITTLFALIFGVIFIIFIDVLSPELHFLKMPHNASLYLLFLAVNSILSLTGVAFVAIRKSEYQFFKSIVSGSRVIFVMLFVGLGAFGIFDAIGMSFIVTLLFSFFLLAHSKIKPKFAIDRNFLNDAFHFSLGNYFAVLLMSAPIQIIPILVLNTTGAEESAYYYISFSIVSLLFMIPDSISMSLFVEGSHGKELKKTVLKSVFAVFSILIPSVAFLYFGGGWILDIFGKSYSENGLELLRIMIFTSIFMAINSIYFSIKRIQKDVKVLVVISGLVGGLLIILGYVFLVIFGIIGIGYAWVISYGIGSLIVLTLIWKEGWV